MTNDARESNLHRAPIMGPGRVATRWQRLEQPWNKEKKRKKKKEKRKEKGGERSVRYKIARPILDVALKSERATFRSITITE